jgi:hypothetical protein
MYELNSNPEKAVFRFYRMKNTWDPVSSEALAEYERIHYGDILNQTTLTTLKASSTLTEPHDQNAYHPAKLFDNDPKTMWIENAAGPGLGESVAIGFDSEITIDEIQIQPGCFWDTYWKQNYRVKKLEVSLGGKSYTVGFKDIMETQSIKLPEAVTAREVTLTIRAVYPTTNWEDTAISGVWFLNDGERYEVDYSRYAEFVE